MIKLVLAAGVAALAIPCAALAGPACLGQTHDNRVAGTVVGAGAEALSTSNAVAPQAPMAGGAAMTCVDYQEGGLARGGEPMAPAAGGYGADIAYTGAPGDIGARETTIEQQIHAADARGAINRFQAQYDFNRLAAIRKFQIDRVRRDHGLNAVDRADIYAKLDDLTVHIDAQRNH